MLRRGQAQAAAAVEREQSVLLAAQLWEARAAEIV